MDIAVTPKRIVSATNWIILMKLTVRTAPHFRDTPQGMVLVALQNENRNELQFPPPAFIHGSSVQQEVLIGPVGQLYTYTVVHPGKEVKPYGLAMVDFAPGVRVFGRLELEQGQTPALDSKVRVVPFTLPDGTPDYAFSAFQGEQQ